MALELVTRAEAYVHLRLDYDSSGSAEDDWLGIFIPAVSQAVAAWLKDDWRLWELERDSDGALVLDSSGTPVSLVDSAGDKVPLWTVKAAVLMELASQYRFREGEGTDNTVSPDAGYGYVLNKASTAILAPLRRPTVA